MRTEVRVYHFDQGNLFGAVKVEQFRTIGEARERCEFWTEEGFVAIPVRAGRTEAVKSARPPGWGAVQKQRVLVERKSRDHINARRQELGRLRKLGLAPPVKHRKRRQA